MMWLSSLLLAIHGALGGIVASKIAPYGSSTTDVPSSYHDANSLKYVYYQDIPISYYEYGNPDDPTVIATGGWPPGASQYNDFAATLAKRGVHVVLYDQRGAGKSGHPWGPEGYSITNLANEMGAVIDAVSPDKRVIVWGGTWSPFIASEHCSMYPDSHRIAAIMSTGGPSFDLGYQALIDQTKNLVFNQQNLTKVLSQWIMLSYEEEIAVPVIPEVLAETGLPNWIESKIQDGLHALNSSNANALADVLNSEIARALIYNFGDYDKDSMAHGEQKYQWYVFNRVVPGILSGKMYRQNLPVDRVKVWQMENDSIQTDIMNIGLGERTPNLSLTYLPGGHSSTLSGNNTEIMQDTIVEWLKDI